MFFLGVSVIFVEYFLILLELVDIFVDFFLYFYNVYESILYILFYSFISCEQDFEGKDYILFSYGFSVEQCLVFSR